MATAELKAILSCEDNFTSKITTAASATEKMTSSLESAGGSLSSAEAAAKSAGSGVEEIEKAASKAGQSTEKLGEEAKGLGENLGDAEEQSKDLGASLETMANIANTLKISEIAFEITEKLLEAAEGAAEFETALAKVSTIADTAAVPLSELKEDITALSNDMGQSVEALSEAAYQALSASVDTASAVEFTETATQLAVGGFTEAATAVDVLTTALNAYGLEASEAGNISDMLVTTQNLGKTTVDQLASSMGRVIPVAAAYNVEMDNLSSAFALLTKNGISTRFSAAYLKSMLSELGDTSSEVSSILQEQTGYTFDQLSEKGYSLGDVMATLGDAVNNNTVAFSGLWSSQEAGVAALSMLNAGADEYNSILESMETSSGAAAKAYETMADTTEYAQQSMANAAKNAADAIGEDLNPALKAVYETGEKMFEFMGEFIEDTPVVSDLLAGLAAALGTVAAALAAMAAKAAIAAAAEAGFLALNPPLLAVAAAVGLVVTAFTGLANLAGKVEDATNELTLEYRNQEKELKRLQDEYDFTVSVIGEESNTAKDLRYEIMSLTEEFENNKQTIGEMAEEADALISTHDELVEKYEESSSELEENTRNAEAMIYKLGELGEANNDVIEGNSQMETLVERLNEQYPELAGVYEQTAGSASAYAEAAEKIVKAQASLEKQDILKGQIADYGTQADIAKAKWLTYNDKLAAAIKVQNDEYAKMSKNQITIGPFTFTPRTREYGIACQEVETLNSKTAGLRDTYYDYVKQLEEAEQELEILEAQRIENIKLAGEEGDATEVLSLLAQEQADSIAEVTEAYNNAYEAAKSSLEGQLGLFNDVDATSELTFDQMIERLEKQALYVENFQKNLETLRGYGASQEFLDALAESGQEGAQTANQLVWEFSSLGAEKVEADINKLNELWEKRDSVVEGTSQYIAENDTEYTTALNTAVENFNAAIDKLKKDGTLSEDIIDTAGDTVRNFIAGITGKTEETEAAANEIVSAVLDPIMDIDLEGTGGDIVQGLINGMQSKQNPLLAMATSIANTVKDAINGTLDINSPSKVTYKTGVFTAEGAIEGIKSMMSEAEDVSTEFANGLNFSDKDINSLRSSSVSGGSNSGGGVTVYLSMDGQTVNISNGMELEDFTDGIVSNLRAAMAGMACGV